MPYLVSSNARDAAIAMRVVEGLQNSNIIAGLSGIVLEISDERELWVQRELSHHDSSVRSRAVIALPSLTNYSHGVQKAIDVLQDISPDVRLAGLGAINLYGDKAMANTNALFSIIGLARSDTDESVRDLASQILRSSVFRRPAEAHFSDRIQNVKDFEEAEFSLAWLKSLPFPFNLKGTVVAIIKSESYPFTLRSLACDALFGMGSQATSEIPELVAALSNESPSMLMHLLGNLLSKPEFVDKVIPELLALAETNSVPRKLAGIRGLERLGHQALRAKSRLEQLVSNDKNPEVLAALKSAIDSISKQQLSVEQIQAMEDARGRSWRAAAMMKEAFEAEKKAQEEERQAGMMRDTQASSNQTPTVSSTNAPAVDP